MKKLLIFITIFLLFASSAIAYNPTEKDIKNLNFIYKKLENIGEKYPEKVKKLGNQISSIKDKYKSKEKIYFFLSEIENYINKNYMTYYVSKVIDGDTLEINYNSKESYFRLIGIDAPESYLTRYGYKECYGDEAKEYLKNLIEGKYVKIEFDETQGKIDKYGRFLAYIFLNGENVNDKMIKDGYAWEYTYNEKYNYKEVFSSSQKIATENKNGLWSISSCNGERKKIEEEKTIKIEQKDESNINDVIGKYSCGTKKYCNQMNTCEEAKFYLNDCGLTRLDADSDGIPCESICQ